MNILMRTLFNLRSARPLSGGNSVGVACVIDEQTGVECDELRRLLHVWRDWLTLDAVLTRSTPLQLGALQGTVSPACRVVVVVSERAHFLEAVRCECASSGFACVDSEYPSPAAPRELALCQEVAHHDFEIGGLNEWDGRPTQNAQSLLQSLSRTHCERIFPQFLLPYIRQFHERDNKPVETLDIGCGPISVLRWGALRGLLRVTGVDPLLDMYRIIRERHGLTDLPAIACHRELSIIAEELTTFLSPQTYDIIFTRNAIDHVEDPLSLIGQACGCLRAGGLIVLDFHTKEGSRQHWEQLHQFDLYLDEKGQLLCQTQEGLPRPLVPEETGLFVQEVVARNEDFTVVILKQGEARISHEQQQQRAAEWRAQREQTRRESSASCHSPALAPFRRFRHALRRWL